MKSRGLAWARSNKVKLNCGRRMKKGRIQVVPRSFPKQALQTASKIIPRRKQADRKVKV